MARKSKPLWWPWLAGVVGLCGLSLLAPRLWRSDYGTRAIIPLLDGVPVSAVSQVDRGAAADASREWHESDGTSGAGSLAALAAPRFFAPAAPPVADRVETVAAELESPPALPPVPSEDAAPLLIAARSPQPLEPPRGIHLEVPRQTIAPEPARRNSVWPRPEALLAQLDELEPEPECEDWVRRVRRCLQQLEQAGGIGANDVESALSDLAAAVRDGGDLVSMADNAALWSKVARTCHAITRRVEIWRRIHQLTLEDRTLIVSTGGHGMGPILADVQRLMRPPQPQQLARAWREYLLLDALRLVDSSPDVAHAARREIARRVLNRMSAPTLTVSQKDFLARPEFVALQDHLRLWAYEPVDYVQLLEQIENCELRMAAGRSALIDDWQTLRWSPWQQTAELADLLEAYYRNANLRIAVSADMLNRLLPEMHVTEEDVHDQILGARVQGRSRTFTRLFVVLVPDRWTWRMGLVARGQVDSHTRAAKGPVTLFNSGATRYRARKLLTIDRRGVRLENAEAEADSRTRLMNVASEFDSLPLVGSLVRSIAVREHRELSPQADAEVEYKVTALAAQRLDEQVQQNLEQAKVRYEKQLLEPLRRLQLNPVALEMQTTDERLIVRYRVAANHQLAAYTPRPQAPIDSALSVQLNDSVLNNMVGQLRLAGRAMDLGTLFRELTAAVGRPDLPMPEDFPEDAHIEFADVDPVRVRFADGHAALSLRIAALTSGRRTWRDFEVHTRYAPIAAGRQVWLVRDDFIELRGGRLGFRDRLPLRGIFTTLMAKERKLPLVGKQFIDHPRLTDLAVTQLVLHDGWLGLAIGPADRVARKP